MYCAVYNICRTNENSSIKNGQGKSECSVESDLLSPEIDGYKLTMHILDPKSTMHQKRGIFNEQIVEIERNH